MAVVFGIVTLGSLWQHFFQHFLAEPTVHTNIHVHNMLYLSKYQKGVYYSGIKLFNNLPPTIKNKRK
jgi:hypothetical protein